MSRSVNFTIRGARTRSAAGVALAASVAWLAVPALGPAGRAGAAHAASLPGQSAGRWIFPLSDVRSLDLDLIAADVVIDRMARTPSISISSEGQSPSGVTIAATADDGRLRIRDVFPPRGRWVKECLPPVDERGDFWTHHVRWTVRIGLPPAATARIRVRSGTITALGGRAGLDLQSGDGPVRDGQPLRAPAKQ